MVDLNEFSICHIRQTRNERFTKTNQRIYIASHIINERIFLVSLKKSLRLRIEKHKKEKKNDLLQSGFFSFFLLVVYDIVIWNIKSHNNVILIKINWAENSAKKYTLIRPMAQFCEIYVSSILMGKMQNVHKKKMRHYNVWLGDVLLGVIGLAWSRTSASHTTMLIYFGQLQIDQSIDEPMRITIL